MEIIDRNLLLLLTFMWAVATYTENHFIQAIHDERARLSALLIAIDTDHKTWGHLSESQKALFKKTVTQGRQKAINLIRYVRNYALYAAYVVAITLGIFGSVCSAASTAIDGCERDGTAIKSDTIIYTVTINEPTANVHCMPHFVSTVSWVQRNLLFLIPILFYLVALVMLVLFLGGLLRLWLSRAERNDIREPVEKEIAHLINKSP